MARYTHTTQIHNLDSPKEIVPVLTSLLPIQSVVDIGCGLGTFLKVFKEHGIQDVFGVDGKWCNKQLLFENIQPKEFAEMDLDKPIELKRKFDLAVSLEVAEHLHESRATTFVADLTKLSDVILFSAAIPFQGGDHHYNEQWLYYWAVKFAESGYELYDVLKPLYWNNPKIFWWYKQNMVLFIKKGKATEAIKKLPHNALKNVIHPELFEVFANPNSSHSLKRHVKLSLKALLGPSRDK
jgi:SAM-dependent methyltransferase